MGNAGFPSYFTQKDTRLFSNDGLTQAVLPLLLDKKADLNNGASQPHAGLGHFIVLAHSHAITFAFFVPNPTGRMLSGKETPAHKKHSGTRVQPRNSPGYPARRKRTGQRNRRTVQSGKQPVLSGCL